MLPDQLDRTDMAILHLLQTDARNATTEEIGERVGLSSSSVATRIRALEDEGIITGYAPVIDYEAAGFDHHVLIRATVPDDDRDSIVENAIEISNIIALRELVTNEGNVLVEVISPTQEGVEAAIAELNDLEIEVLDTELLKTEFTQAFGAFGEKYVVESGE
ncbi:Lrp/AsnC family transcriptional regulator [Natrononativus amylolyticus]|uniref:Lrp/AsnC family transcriptional regulator n=1 Tax=Natrononativus amylolyticus TaxID=2963434 RepID=UPI0020CF1C72|nr:winged helix-turn-helix transcriptional regulator [Natrononativus amylolyticus]